MNGLLTWNPIVLKTEVFLESHEFACVRQLLLHAKRTLELGNELVNFWLLVVRMVVMKVAMLVMVVWVLHRIFVVVNRSRVVRYRVVFLVILFLLRLRIA